MHWFEPYVFSFLLCKTKTVKKVSITDEIIAHLCIWIWMDLVGLVACLLRPRNRYLNQGEQWTYSGLSELWWHAASPSTQIQIRITLSLLRMEMLLWDKFFKVGFGKIIANLMNPGSVQLFFRLPSLAHLNIALLGGNPEVGNSEYTDHQDCPPRLL